MPKQDPSDPLRPFGKPPTLGEIEELARRVFDALPATLTAQCRNIAIRVEDFADDETLRDMEIESPFDLAGLYRGAPLTAKGAADVAQHLDMILLYRRPMIDWWAEEEVPFEDVVRHLLVHEIGHHFGFSDEDMERIEQATDEDDR